MKKRQKILQLQPLISKTLDTLCLELALTEPDSNSYGLIQILNWRINDQISKTQFSQLYRAWVSSKQVVNIFKTKQIGSIDKAELILQQKIPKQLIDLHQITKMLELINEQYNTQFLEIYQKPQLLQNLQLLFSYLDPQGTIHIRISQLLFLFQSLIITKVIILKQKHIKTFNQQFKLFLNECNTVNGKLSLRNFKNFMVHKCNCQTLIKIMRNLKQMQKLNGKIDSLPDIFYDCIVKWGKTSQRFGINNSSSSLNKNKLQQYQRIFQQHDYLFVDIEANSQQIQNILTAYYSRSYLMLHDIDFIVIRQFLDIIKESMQKYIKSFLTNNSTLKDQTKTMITTRNKNIINKVVTVQKFQNQISKQKSAGNRKKRIQTNVSAKKMLSTNHHIPSINNPINLQHHLLKKAINNNHTPNKTSNLNLTSVTPSRFQLSEVRSIKNVNNNTKNNINATINNITSQKQKQTKPSHQYIYDQQQNDENSTLRNNCKSQQELLQQMTYFRNKRVEPFDVVMKRLKKNKK